jgi:dephospho-CoA kinase
VRSTPPETGPNDPGGAARERHGSETGHDRHGPLVVGVTGNIASGKSTVLAMLGERGAQTIDADAVYHRLIAPGLPLWSALRDRFGPGIIGPEGTIDRGALGKIVFGDPAALADLDALTHPAVIAAIDAEVAASDAAVVAIGAVKLIESGHADHCDRVWLVTCDPEEQVARLMRRNGLSREDAQQRVAAQPPLAPKLLRADAVIDNSGDLASTREQVDAAWSRLRDTSGRAMDAS